MPFYEDKILWMLLLILHSLVKFPLKLYKPEKIPCDAFIYAVFF